MLRHQLPVRSPVRMTGLARAAVAALAAAPPHSLESAVRARWSAGAVVLTDSGTSALVLALRLAMPRGGAVALPAWGCPDLVAAAVRADARVRLYDLDPCTLTPDLVSLEAALSRGADAVVVVHYFGYPADVPAVAALAERHGAVVIEDAAQGAGGELHGRTLGALAPLSVVSFGRGKGLSGGGGGALLARGPWRDAVESLALRRGGRGVRELVSSAAIWLLGRPACYMLPASLPWLRLGETRYRAAGEPRGPSAAACALVASALELEAADVAGRRERAARLSGTVRAGLIAVAPIGGAAPGYLRLAVRDVESRRAPAPALGVVRGYPAPLASLPELAAVRLAGDGEMPGADELSRTLLTLPTHAGVTDADARRIERCLAVGAPAPSRAGEWRRAVQTRA